MSTEALFPTLALKRMEGLGPKHKDVLIALANVNNAAGESFLCVKEICERTWWDRKAVISAIADLRERGLIVDTGKRRGRTGQVIVWTLPYIDSASERSRKRDTYGTEAVRFIAEVVEGQQPQASEDECEGSRIGNGSASGTVSERVPDRDAKGPALEPKGSRIGDTEPSTRLNPLPRGNPPAEGEGRADAHPPARMNGSNPKPDKPKPAKKSPKDNPGKRLVPEDWTPPAELRADLEQRFPAVAVGDEIERFRDYSRANDKRFKDFHAAFRNWIRKAADFAKRDGKGPSGGGSRRYLD